MADHELIDAYLRDVRRRLPANAVDELADGLAETYERCLARTGDPSAAAAATVAEFGGPDLVATEFVRQAPGRRVALALLATGPGVGACWGTALIAGHAWTWHVPVPARVAFGVLLLGTITTLALAATARRGYRRTRLAAAGACALVGLDAVMLGTVAAVAPALAWPMAVAVPVSLARVGLTLRALPRVLAR